MDNMFNERRSNKEKDGLFRGSKGLIPTSFYAISLRPHEIYIYIGIVSRNITPRESNSTSCRPDLGEQALVLLEL